MIKLKKTLLIVLLILVSFSLFASEGDWWDGKAITAFYYTGLQNVKQKTIDALLNSYVGQNFSDQLFSDITTTLYAQDWLNWFEASAELAEGTDDLVIVLAIHENPYINSVSFQGNSRLRLRTLRDGQNLSEGGFFNSNQLNANVNLVKDTYLSRGYIDSKVYADFVENDEKNIVDIVYTIEEGKQYKVRETIFEGNNEVSSKELKKLLSQKNKSFFNAGNYIKSNVDNDKNSILMYYGTKGYPDANFSSVDVEPTGEETDEVIYLNIIYKIEEGPQWFVGDITFEGNEVFSSEDISSQIKISAGDVYDIQKISNAIGNIASLYYDSGYIRASINPVEKRDNDNHIIGFDLQIVEGPQSVVEEIIISGLTKTKSYVFEREVAMKVGDVFSRADYIKSQQNLMNTGLLKGIKAQLYPSTTSDGVIVEYIVEEGNQMELQFGATFGGNTEGFPVSGFLQWADKNLAGTGRDLAISTTLSPSTQSISLSINDDWVGDKRWSNGFSISLERNAIENALQLGKNSISYDGRDENKESYPLGYTNAADWYKHQITPDDAYLMDYTYWRIALGYNTGYSFVWNPGTLSISGGLSIGLNHATYDSGIPYERLIQRYHDSWQFSNKLSFALTWDGRDFKQNTTRGYILSMNYTYAGGFLYGLSNYNKISMSAAGYHSLFTYTNDEDESRSLVLSATSSVSFMLPQYSNLGNYDKYGWHDAHDGATKYEMLYIDGMNIGRGFSVVYDQAFLWHNQVELTYPLVYQVLSLEGFVSATAVVKDLKMLESFSNLNWYFAGGVGIRMQIPGFPLGLYLVKNATIKDGDGWKWNSGPLFRSSKRDSSGLSLVLAITTSLY